jgi:predicted 2-oxoglutarate/Fe(II)-dependent dioxygenase YbiX
MDIKVTDLIYRINSFMPKNKCDLLINLFEKNAEFWDQERSLKYLEDQEKHIHIDNFKCLNLHIHRVKNKELEEGFKICSQYIQGMILNYINYLKIKFSKSIDAKFISTTDNIRILRYEVGDEIKDHLDTDLTIRGSCTINLNEKYEGGEFTFFSRKHEEILKTGDGIIFPAEHIWVHGTKPVTKGVRYSINCFLKPI